MSHEYDKSSKWLIQHHGDSVLRLAGVQDIESWRPLHPEQVEPRRVPDGLLEVVRTGQTQRKLYLLEAATRPEERVQQQLAEGAMFVYLDRGELPEVICLVLHRHGRKRVPRSISLQSPDRHTRLRMNWTVIELWNLPARSLLEAEDIGVVPWIPLSDVGNSPRPILQHCRQIIDEKAPENEHENLLVVTAILAGLRYTETDVFPLLGDRKMIFESPLLKDAAEEIREVGRQEGRQEGLQAAIVRLLTKHFAEIPDHIRTGICNVNDVHRLEELLDKASDCTDLASFEAELN